MGGGCYSEGCYWEVVAIRRGFIGRWLLFGGVILSGGCYSEGYYWEGAQNHKRKTPLQDNIIWFFLFLSAYVATMAMRY